MKKCLFVLLILSLFLTGCWDQRELDELAITLAIGIDKVEDEYQVTAQVVVPSEVSMKGSMGGAAVTLFQESGETVYVALRKITKDSPRKIYPGHLRMLVLGDELAREGVGESLDLLARDWELRSDFYVVVAKEMAASEILNVTTELENIPANKMFSSLKTSDENLAGTSGITLDMLISGIISEGKEAVLTGIQLTGDEEIGSSKQNMETITPSVRIQYDHLAVFKKDKLVGWLNEEESRGYANITNSIKSTVTAISCPNEGTATIEVNQFHSEMKGNISNGKPEVDIKIKAEGNVGEVECPINLVKQETIDELEKIYEKETKELINQTITALQKKYEVDIFGFGEAIHRSNPKEWKKMKERWNEEFSDLTVNVKIDMKIRHIGIESNSFLEGVKD